jgi:hypothetical protein
MGLMSWAKNKISSFRGNFVVSPNVLDHFGIHAYNSIKKSLVELISNSYDADATEVRITLPLPGAAKEIVVEDNGVGMSPEEFQKHYLHIGRNRRTEGDVSKSGRRVIGNKGIGKLAGFGIADTIRVETAKNGLVTVAHLRRSDFESFENLESAKFDIETHQIPDKNLRGTKVILKDLRTELSTPDRTALRRYLRNNLPKHESFTVFVDDTECTSEDTPGTKTEFTEKIEGLGTEVSGFYIISNSNIAEPGLAIRVRGRLVTKPSFFGIMLDSVTSQMARRFTGEVSADFMDEQDPKRPGVRSLINTSRDGFIEDNERVERFNQWVQDFVKRRLLDESKRTFERKSEAVLKDPEVISRLSRLPKDTQIKARQMIQSALPRLRDAEEGDVKHFVNLILRYFESNVLKELLDSIISAEDQDVEKLAEMISEWGLREVASVTDIVTQQVKIIHRLSDLVANSDTLEDQIHKIFEKNIWLLDEKYKLWASNRQLKTILDDTISDRYKDRENLRPDIVCRNEGNTVVIIEFKRPKEIISKEHLAQAVEYGAIIKSSMPNIGEVFVYVIGKKYDPVIQDIKVSQAKAGNHFLSFSEVLAGAEARFERVLKALEGDS